MGNDLDYVPMRTNKRHLLLQRLLTAALFVCLPGCAISLKAPANSSVPSKFATAGLGKRVRIGTVAIMPLSVLEDSRCPANVQCIQAGTVRIAAKLRLQGKSETATLGFMMPYQLGDRWIHLVAACPYPVHPVTIAQADYRFTFAVEPKAIATAYEEKCFSRR